MEIGYVPVGFDFFGPDGLPRVGAVFAWMWWAEMACVACLAYRRFGTPPAGRRFPRPSDPSRVWVLPLLVWGLQSVLHFKETLWRAGTGLSHPSVTIIHDAAFEIMLALLILVTVQSVAVWILGGCPATLGLGIRHPVGAYVILNITFILGTIFFILDLYQRPYSFALLY